MKTLWLCAFMLLVDSVEAQNSKKQIRTHYHSKGITAIAVNPYGDFFATTSFDSKIKIWDIKNGVLLNTLEGHKYAVRDIKFNKDGTWLASAGNDQTIIIWDVSDGNLIRQLRGHDHHITSIVFSDDDKFLYSGSQDNTIRKWEISSGKEVALFQTSFVQTLALHPGTNRLISGHYDHSIKIWDLEKKEVNGELKKRLGSIQSIAVSPNEKFLAVSRYKYERVRLLNSKDLTPIKTLWHPGGAKALTFNEDSGFLFTGGLGGKIRIWNPESWELLETLVGHFSGITSLAIDAKNQKLISGDGDGKIVVWDISDYH